MFAWRRRGSFVRPARIHHQHPLLLLMMMAMRMMLAPSPLQKPEAAPADREPMVRDHGLWG
jgi:hypothetical protein